MVTYPIRVPRDHYKGRNPRRLEKRAEKNRISKELEDYLNNEIAKNSAVRQTYIYAFIAIDTGFSEETVRDTLFGVDCGHNGLTVIKEPSLT